MRTFYKLTRGDGSNPYQNYGSLTYSVGATVEVPDAAPAGAGVCARGLHVCAKLDELMRYLNQTPITEMRIWRVEVDEADVIVSDESKTRVRKLLVVEEIDAATVFGPNGDEVLDLVRKLPTFPWLKPVADLDAGIIERLVAQHLYELATYTQSDAFDGVTLRIVRDPAAWDAARDAAWAAAWAAARDAARDAAWDAAWAAARDAAWAAARDAARDAAWDARHLVSGLTNNPWAPLVELWALGCAPVGVVDGEFVVYVPEAPIA